jgi:hypothetical protein
LPNGPRDRTGADPAQTRADVRLGRWIDDFDLFAEALAAGTITTAHVEHIRRTLHNPRTRELLTADQADGTFPVPLINVVASEAVIEDTIKRIAEPSDDPLPLAFDDIDKRCELIDGTPLHPSYLLATLGLATFRRQILTAADRSMDVSVNARCFTPWQKQALLVEARGRCSSKACDAPFAWLQADHTHPHSKGGPTALWNGTMKCGPDNQAKGNSVKGNSVERDRPERPAA